MSDYFSDDELRAAHPDPGFIIYHSIEHTQIVRVMAYDLALADGLSESESRFLSEVALLHDWDPDRQAGVPARVPNTLHTLGLDFAGKRALTAGHEPNTSILGVRFGWTKLQLQMAFGLIYRTEFPFEGPHPNLFYQRASPSERYCRCIDGLPQEAQRFVLRHAPILAQYVDQLSWYATQDFASLLRVVEGLARELDLVSPSPTRAEDLNTTSFLDGIRDPATFEVDHRMARQFGIVDYALPSLDAIFQMLPPHYGSTFHANQSAFDAYDRALEAGRSPHAAAATGLKVFRNKTSAFRRTS